MKTSAKILSLSALMLLTALFVGCNNSDNGDNSNNDDSAGTILPFAKYSFTEESGEEISARWVNLDYAYDESEILVINSDEELEKYVEGNCPSIDFSKKTLVLAYGYHSGAGFGDDIKFRQISDRNYALTLSGLASAALGLVRWHVAIVVDKLPSDSKIELNTAILNP